MRFLQVSPLVFLPSLLGAIAMETHVGIRNITKNRQESLLKKHSKNRVKSEDETFETIKGLRNYNVPVLEEKHRDIQGLPSLVMTFINAIVNFLTSIFCFFAPPATPTPAPSTSLFDPLKIVPFNGGSSGGMKGFGGRVAASDEFFVVGTFGKNAVYMYLPGGEFVRKITAPVGVSGFGETDVAICGEILVIGSMNGTHLYYSNGTFGVTLSGTDENICSVDCSEDTIVEGSCNENDDVGAAYIYDLNGTLVNRIVAPDFSDSEGFGKTVAVSNGKVAVSAPWGIVGRVYIFTTSGSYEKELQPPEDLNKSFFGFVMEISNDLVVISDLFYNNFQGRVFIFSMTTGLIIESLTSPVVDEYLGFGVSIAIANETILIGDTADNSSTGAVYTFLTNGTLVNKIIAPEEGINQYFGWKIAVSGEAVIIGSPGFNNEAGAAYIYFKLPTFTPNDTPAPTTSLSPSSVPSLVPSSEPTTTFAPTSCCPTGKFPFKLEVYSGSSASETSWQITKDDDGSIVDENPVLEDETLYEEDYCLDNGCYTFTIKDAFGDGICCISDEGYFNGYLYRTRYPHFKGGDFSFKDSKTFCGEDQCSV